jgi:hypothetical protein
MERTGRTSRRDVLKMGGLGALAVASVAVGTAVLDASSGPASAAGVRRNLRVPQPGAQELRRETFQPLVGSTFTLRTANGTQDVVLTAVKPHKTARTEKGECFSLLFSVPAKGAVESGTYSMAHPALGTFGMFVSAVGQRGADRRYEAVVNRY